jgi:putative transposase
MGGICLAGENVGAAMSRRRERGDASWIAGGAETAPELGWFALRHMIQSTWLRVPFEVSSIQMRRPAQLEFPSHGGRRKGAGRPKGNRVSHRARPAFSRSTPAHVTLRVRGDVPNLRSSRRFAVIRRGFTALRSRKSFRLIKFSVLGNHLHLIVEADDSVALARGMQSLNTRLAMALNKLLGRRGTLFEDHYHSHLLKSPTEVARALAYVRTNAERHYSRGIESDYYSSDHSEWRDLLAAPVTWLLNAGWKLVWRSKPKRELLRE